MERQGPLGAWVEEGLRIGKLLWIPPRVLASAGNCLWTALCSEALLLASEHRELASRQQVARKKVLLVTVQLVFEF